MNENKFLTPEEIVKILAEYGEVVTKGEAILIQDFMLMIADITIAQYLREEESNNALGN